MAEPAGAPPSSADSAVHSVDFLLAPYLTSESTRPIHVTEGDIRQLSTGLNRLGNPKWSKIPRIYLVLRMINQLQHIDSFLSEGVSDIWFPFSHNTLPESLRSQSARCQFLESQDVVLTKALDLEREDGKHRHFSKSEDIPFDKVEELGKGGFGYVDRVRSTVSFKEYARKLLPRGKTFRKNKQVIKDFERELSHLKRLSHIHIVELIGSYTDPKFVGILMSPVADYNLKDFLTRDSLSSGERSFLRTFFGCLANALCYLHEEKVRHKDIKPQNVLVKGHQVYLTDFGISLDWSEIGESTTTGISVKTPRYCAPEVSENLPRNWLSDVWSLGCVFLEIWTVLRGESLKALLEYLSCQGSKSTCYCLNIDSSIEWSKSLEGESENGEENLPLPWILAMLQVDQEMRWTARKLVDQIQEVNENPDYRYAFSGLCCVGGDDSSDSESTFKRSSQILEETCASLVGVYYPKSTTVKDETKPECLGPDLSSLTKQPSKVFESDPQADEKTIICELPNVPTTLVKGGALGSSDKDEMERKEALQKEAVIERTLEQEALTPRASQTNHDFASPIDETVIGQQRKSFTRSFIPKAPSRWSKTTASSADRHIQRARQFDYPQDYRYPDDRLRSSSSLRTGNQHESEKRPITPLLPSQGSDNPSFQAHRDNPQIIHPQPRRDPIGRSHHHQVLGNALFNDSRTPSPEISQTVSQWVNTAMMSDNSYKPLPVLNVPLTNAAMRAHNSVAFDNSKFMDEEPDPFHQSARTKAPLSRPQSQEEPTRLHTPKRAKKKKQAKEPQIPVERSTGYSHIKNHPIRRYPALEKPSKYDDTSSLAGEDHEPYVCRQDRADIVGEAIAASNPSAEDMTIFGSAEQRPTYALPNDESPITIPVRSQKPDGTKLKPSNPSDTSLLIEYFEAGKHPQAAPSVRVRVRPPESRKKNKVRLAPERHPTHISPETHRKPSTRALRPSDHTIDDGRISPLDPNTEFIGTEVVAPVGIEVGYDASPASDYSSYLEDDQFPIGKPETNSQTIHPNDLSKDGALKQADLRPPDMSAEPNLSKKRIPQKVTERLSNQDLSNDATKSQRRNGKSPSNVSMEEVTSIQAFPRRRTAKDFEHNSTAFPSASKASDRNAAIKNLKLLQTVEDAIRRLILPELKELKKDQKLFSDANRPPLA